MRCRNCEISSALREINGAPIVDVVEVKYGKWIWDDNAIDWGLGDWVCDQCYSTNENIGADNPNTSPKGFSNPYGVCDHYIMAHEKAYEEDFCSYGERK